MSYIKAELILPLEILELVQLYAGGQYLYIPKKEENRKAWGENSNSKAEVIARNVEIYTQYIKGINANDLAKEYYLSIKSIQRIVLYEKRNQNNK